MGLQMQDLFTCSQYLPTYDQKTAVAATNDINNFFLSKTPLVLKVSLRGPQTIKKVENHRSVSLVCPWTLMTKILECIKARNWHNMYEFVLIGLKEKFSLIYFCDQLVKALFLFDYVP